MNNVKTTAVSGCVIWFLLISLIGACIVPVFMAVGIFSSFTTFAIDVTGGWLCPEGTTPEQYTYSTTSYDEYHNPQPATAYELHCVDATGSVVKTDPVGYSFLWIGIWSLVGLIISVILTFVFAVPGGMLVTRFLNKMKVTRAGTS